MVGNFVETTIFTKQWKSMNLDDRDLLCLQIHLMKNPNDGDVIVGTGGARKIRFALPHKGKSGGARVIYVSVVQDKEIYLLLCYPKGKQENLTEEQKKQLKTFIKVIKEGNHG